MPATLPPWLNVQPTDFLQAAEAGAGVGLRRQGMANEMMQFQQGQAMKQQALQQEEQDRQERVKQAAQQHQVAVANLQLETQRAQVEKQTSEMRMNLEATAAAQKFQSMRRYQDTYDKMVAAGIDPADAAIQASLQNPGLESSASLSGIASIRKATMPYNPQVKDFGGGVRALQTGPQSSALIPEKVGGVWKDVTKTISGEETPGQALFDEGGNQIGPWYANDRGAAFEKAGASGNKQSVTAYERAIQKYQDTKSKMGRLFDRDGSMLKNTRRIAMALESIDPGNPFAADFLDGEDAPAESPPGSTKIGRFSVQTVGQ